MDGFTLHRHRRGGFAAPKPWLAVGSPRLISSAPLLLINFCAGISSIRLASFLIATAVRVVPGMIALVMLGDALTGGTDPALPVVSALSIALEAAGLVVDARLGVHDGRFHRDRVPRFGVLGCCP